MEKFKVGDRVRLTENVIGDWHVKGETGEIVEVDEEFDEYIVDFDRPDIDGDRLCVAYDEILELIDEANA